MEFYDALPYKFWRFGRMADARLIYLFEIADNLGRINRNGPKEALDLIELFRMACEEHEVWDNPCHVRPQRFRKKPLDR